MPTKLPVLSDFLVLSKVEEILGQSVSFEDRIFDEKFSILNAPRLFLPDLAYYRLHCCELRDRPVSIAYMDIDNFKTFNTDLGEPAVDRDVLPFFIRILEAVIYGHGHAYRYGGDEYLTILPNRNTNEATELLEKFQEALSQAIFSGVQSNPTVSIGVCEVTNDSFFTNRQAEEWAAKAKQFAKDKGRNRIAGFSGDIPSDENLQILHPKIEDSVEKL